MPAGLSTWCRGASEAPADFHARAEALGAAGLALDATLPRGWLAELAAELARRTASLPVFAVEAPCPRGHGARPPFLTAADAEERRAAVHATHATIRLAVELGAGVVVVKLGRLDVRHDWARTVRAFARGTFDEDDAARRLADRAQLAARALDAARRGIDPVVERAAAAGVTLAIANTARWFELPDDPELLALFEDFRGAPLAAWHDPAAAYVRETLGFGGHADGLALLGKRAAGAWLTDAAGLQGGLPWGRGEVDAAAVAAALPEGAVRAVHCAPWATDHELAEALAR